MDEVEVAGATFSDCRRVSQSGESAERAAALAWYESFGGSSEHLELFYSLRQSDPVAADRILRSVSAMPEAGDDFLGFHLVQELGRGAYGRVFLCHQKELADRLVALKISVSIEAEQRTLPQLQHTNIVPVYSVHHADPFHAVCMPYFGSTTLDRVLTQLRSAETLPASGYGLWSTRPNTGEPAEPGAEPLCSDVDGHPGTNGPLATPDQDLLPTAKMLEQMSYVEGVVWLAARLADGLAHAHERGILHRDLKPANILLTDDCQPMLLDFNLSQDTKLRDCAAGAMIGGTLPYMAPEHLLALAGAEDTPVDARADVYSLGVVLFEMLTGVHPFTIRRAPLDRVLASMLEERGGPIPDVRSFNPNVSPAVSSIVRHCLQDAPAQRYQNARQLHEDLQRHLADLPLKHTAEPSLWERCGKWHRRNRRFAATALALISACLLLVFASLFVREGHRRARLQAADTFEQFQSDLSSVQYLLSVATNDPSQISKGIELCRQSLGRYPTVTAPDEGEPGEWQFLSAAQRGRLDGDLGELLLLFARGHMLLADVTQDPGAKREKLEAALAINERAERHCGTNKMPRALWLQRAELQQQLGQGADAEHSLAQAAQTPLQTVSDHSLVARELAVQGQLREALPLFRRATQLDAKNLWAWFGLGYCYEGLGQDSDAISCYTACTVLRPDFPWACFNRGLIFSRMHRLPQALADFDHTICIAPHLTEAYVNRALVKKRMRDYAGSIDDLTRAQELGAPQTRICFIRARVRKLTGDLEGAERDRQMGLLQEPTDELSWIARSVAETEPQVKLACIERALELNPRSQKALQNKSHILAELMGRTDEAIAVLDRALELFPDYLWARSGRGTLLARNGDREAAHRDAKVCLLLGADAATLYQVGCLYALTSRQEPGDRLRAFPLLAKALREGYGLELLETDPDLAAIREDPGFERLRALARAIKPSRRDKL